MQRMVYQVDGLRVTGVMLAPEAPVDKQHPLLVYNRGGTAQFGILTVGNMLRLAHYAQQGYLVFASNYRGNDGGDGLDEFGGGDVHDVLTLLDIGRQHPGWDGRNTFMHGHSRGAMMTFLAIRHGAALRAAAGIAGPADLQLLLNHRPDMHTIYERHIPGFLDAPQATLAERAALCWPEALNVPLLLLHGDKDERVDIAHTARLDAALSALGKPHATVVYPGGDHSLTGFRKESQSEISAWFFRHHI